MKKTFVFIWMLYLLSMSSCKKEKNRICDLYSSPVGYSVGLVESSVSVPFKVTYNFIFVANGVEYFGKEKGYGINQDGGILIGKQFVVVYEKNNPSNNDLNTDFYIETDLDFQEFKTQYSTSIPNPDFPNKCR